MRLIFCSHPLDRQQPDPDFAEEWEAAAGFERSLLNFEALLEGRVELRGGVEGPALYRGWMLTPERYARLYERLDLINSPEQYRHCHYLPEWYPLLAEVTPLTTTDWRQLPPGPAIVKDYVKSCKHAWDEACYLPDTRDDAACQRVVDRFLELQGPDLNVAPIFRQFVSLGEEHRLFILDGELLWGAGEPHFLEEARRVRSRFFSMDVARCQDGAWIVIELGDGQVSGLPEGRAREFYEALSSRRRAR